MPLFLCFSMRFDAVARAFSTFFDLRTFCLAESFPCVFPLGFGASLVNGAMLVSVVIVLSNGKNERGGTAAAATLHALGWTAG